MGFRSGYFDLDLILAHCKRQVMHILIVDISYMVTAW